MSDELVISTNDPDANYWDAGDVIKVRDTGEIMRIDAIRPGREREVWRIPTHYRWGLRWRVVPWRKPYAWSFGGEVESVPAAPHPKAARRVEREMFVDITRGAGL